MTEPLLLSLLENAKQNQQLVAKEIARPLNAATIFVSATYRAVRNWSVFLVRSGIVNHLVVGDGSLPSIHSERLAI